MIEIDTKIVKFFLDELKPVDNVVLKTEECKCDICTEEYTTDRHRVVRLPCGHIFGESCIETWLSPFAPYAPNTVFKASGAPVGSNTCPMCRRDFLPAQKTADILPVLEARIALWDHAYAEIGIALSDREREARRDLLRYLENHHARSKLDHETACCSANLTDHSVYSVRARDQLVDFAVKLQRQQLTPGQEQLRQRLQNLAERMFDEAVDWCWDDDTDLFYQVISQSEEQRNSRDA